jgi:16S rRNA (cytidine1402-2'-O)-methyltransferase
MSGCLYVFGTPIGNLGDISPRALEILRACDFIAAEDTRVIQKLLNYFEIKKQAVSYYEHNIRSRGELICQRIEAGESCALVTDAGMPAISDPGTDLVNLCHERGFKVQAVPGPSAVVTAIAVSGMNAARFCFEGFLSTAKRSRKEHLDCLREEPRTMVFYEAPHKLGATLKDMLTVFGDRRIAIVRELTKIYEEVNRLSLREAAERYGENTLKGELVLIIEGAQRNEESLMTLSEAAEEALRLSKTEMSLKDAIKAAAESSGQKKNAVYEEVMRRKARSKGENDA